MQQSRPGYGAQGAQAARQPVLGANRIISLGDYSIAERRLFYLEDWARPSRATRHAGEHRQAIMARMRERPAVQRALAGEGLA